MKLTEFHEMVERDRPATLDASLIAKVKPNPWVLRAGQGKDARIRIVVNRELRYERSQGESVWRRVDGAQSDFDVLDDVA